MPDEPPHVTVLGPFVDLAAVNGELLAQLAATFATVERFEFELVEVRAFPGGLTYLAPAPEAPFRALTQRLHRRYPDWPPYRGRFTDVVPHLTVGAVPVGAARVAFAGLLPIRCRATKAHLYWWAPGASRTLARFPLSS